MAIKEKKNVRRGAAIEMKGEMQMLNVLRLHDVRMDAITSALEAKIAELPGFFQNTPLIVDCYLLDERCCEVDFVALREMLSAHGFALVGLRHLPDACQKNARKAGWLILTARPAKQEKAAKKTSPQKKKTERRSELSSRVITRPVRSGQQVYMPEGDLVIVAQTSSGSELLASGSIHVYGKLRGRVLAGVNGDESARIYCQGLEAELIAIAGNYQLLDEADTTLKGQPAMIRLENDKLIIEPII